MKCAFVEIAQEEFEFSKRPVPEGGIKTFVDLFA